MEQSICNHIYSMLFFRGVVEGDRVIFRVTVHLQTLLFSCY